MKRIVMFIMAIMMFTVSVCAETDNNYDVYKVYEFDAGDGITIYKNSDGKWGAYSENFYLDAEYYMPCEYGYYNGYNYYAYNGTFVLALNDNRYLNDNNPENTFCIFNSEGKIIKSLSYTLSDVRSEKPGGYNFSYVFVTGALGSNLVFGGVPVGKETESIWIPEYIKRLYSENVVGGYYDINPKESGEFSAVERDTWRYCSLNPDGSLKNYLYNDDGSYKKKTIN